MSNKNINIISITTNAGIFVFLTLFFSSITFADRGFDLDVFDSYYVKSTGTPVNYGLNLWEIHSILKFICNNNSVKSCDFVEYNPLISDKEEIEKSLLNLETTINTLIKYIN